MHHHSFNCKNVKLATCRIQLIKQLCVTLSKTNVIIFCVLKKQWLDPNSILLVMSYSSTFVISK